jgi:hypothetical protein
LWVAARIPALLAIKTRLLPQAACMAQTRGCVVPLEWEISGWAAWQEA